MTPEERSLLQSTHQLAQENNALLQKLNRRGRLSFWIKFAYWAIIIGLSFGAFFFIQPYIDFVKANLGGGSSTNSNSSGQNSYAEQLRDLLK